MSNRARPVSYVDEAIAAIDVGLQTAGDFSYGTTVPEDRCWRCLDREADPESIAGVCTTCREILLADPEPESAEHDHPMTHSQPRPIRDCSIIESSTARLFYGGTEIPVQSIRLILLVEDSPTVTCNFSEEPMFDWQVVDNNQTDGEP